MLVVKVKKKYLYNIITLKWNDRSFKWKSNTLKSWYLITIDLFLSLIWLYNNVYLFFIKNGNNLWWILRILSWQKFFLNDKNLEKKIYRKELIPIKQQNKRCDDRKKMLSYAAAHRTNCWMTIHRKYSTVKDTYEYTCAKSFCACIWNVRNRITHKRLIHRLTLHMCVHTIRYYFSGMRLSYAMIIASGLFLNELMTLTLEYTKKKKKLCIWNMSFQTVDINSFFLL